MSDLASLKSSTDKVHTIASSRLALLAVHSRVLWECVASPGRWLRRAGREMCRTAAQFPVKIQRDFVILLCAPRWQTSKNTKLKLHTMGLTYYFVRNISLRVHQCFTAVTVGFILLMETVMKYIHQIGNVEVWQWHLATNLHTIFCWMAKKKEVQALPSSYLEE